METIKQQDSGAAVEDVQHRLSLIGLLDEARVDGAFGPETAAAVKAFRAQAELPEGEEVDEKTWAALVDASYSLGDRTLYLRMPYFHGHDVLQLQQALSALGFACGPVDGMFGAFTELALRKFQTNLGLPTDGIAGAYTYSAIRNLHHSWEGKEAVRGSSHLGFARAAGVLERHALCLFGTQEFTRSVASRMSNLALAARGVRARGRLAHATGIGFARGALVEPFARCRRTSRQHLGRCRRGPLGPALRHHVA